MNITKLYLLDTPLEKDYRNTLYFANANAQYTYFYSKRVKSYTDFSYQRKDNKIRVPDEYDNILNCNYVMYQNTAHGNKWYYAFIEKMEYVSDGRTDIYISTDVIQTYLFDYTIKPSFIEREHVTDDTIGKHTIPEGLETGDYICSSKVSLYSGGNTCYICIAVSQVPDGLSFNTLLRQYGGIYSGVSYIVCNTPRDMSNFIRAMDGQGKGSEIVSLFMIPTELCGEITFTHESFPIPEATGTHYIEVDCAHPSYTNTFTTLTTSSNITSPSTINGYSPHNNKLFVYPYNYFYISNNVGNDIDYHYEDFVNNTAQFKTIGTITPGCSIRCFPLNYKKLSDTSATMKSFNYGLTGSKYPICSWNSDTYTNWLTQNGINLGFTTLNAEDAGYIGGAINIASGVALTAGGLGSAGLSTSLGGLRDIFDTMQQSYRHQIAPKEAKGNVNSGDVVFSSSNMDIPLFKMCIKSEYAQIIDQYFDMFGYKVNTVKVPNSNHRQNWWYTKTIACNITGAIPNEDLDKIKNCYNNGITFWKDPTKIYDYSQSNSIVS